MFWCDSPRDVVQLTGPDASTYLHSQLSQNTASLAVGDSAWSFLLQPAGKVDVLVRIWRTADDAFVLDTDVGFGETMTARLNRFKIRVKAELTPLEWRCIALRGTDVVAPGGSVVGWGGGVDLLGEEVTPPADAAPGSAADLEDARIAAGWPAMGPEITPGVSIPAETGVISVAVSFTKGCYPGQELVERMDSRGAEAPHHLVVLPLVAGDAVGGDVVVADTVVGTVTSVGSAQVLARVRRGVEADARS
jgi:folate-binding protein YgfZ